MQSMSVPGSSDSRIYAIPRTLRLTGANPKGIAAFSPAVGPIREGLPWGQNPARTENPARVQSAFISVQYIPALATAEGEKVRMRASQETNFPPLAFLPAPAKPSMRPYSDDKKNGTSQ
jgi:hypothetical protein